jgi:hypothetical protein
MKCTDKELKLLTAALPNSLESLSLQLKGSKATEEGVTALFKHVCHLPRMRRLESDALTSTHMPLVMKMAMLEEFPARGRLFPCAMALINAAAKCAATLKSLDISLDSHFSFRDGAPVGPAGASAVALGLAANSALTKLSLAKNNLGEEGTKAICEALEKNETLKELDLRGGYPSFNNIGGAAGVKHVAKMLRVNGGLTVTNLLGNQLDAESAKMLAEVAKQKGISLCGIQRDQTTADFSKQNLKPRDAILLASDLSQAVVTGGLMSLDLCHNDLCNMVGGTYTVEGITAIADALGALGALTSVDLRGNWLVDEGWGAIFAAICGNKDSKNMSMDVSGEDIGPAGVKLIAEALRTSVTGGLTVTNLLRNHLDVESAKMLAEVAKQKGISLCGIRHDQTTADFSGKFLKLPDAILLASDLSQAVVTGGLTALDLSFNDMGEEGKASIRFAAQGKAGFNLHL